MTRATGTMHAGANSTECAASSADSDEAHEPLAEGGWRPLRLYDVAVMGARRSLTLDLESGRQTANIVCPHCHRQNRRVMQNVMDSDGSTFGVYIASLHDEPAGEAWLDVILGTFGDDAPSDHVTFGCHIVPGPTPHGPAISAVDAAAAFAYRPVMGRRLSRKEALRHPRIEDFWRVVDLSLLADREVRSHILPTRG